MLSIDMLLRDASLRQRVEAGLDQQPAIIPLNSQVSRLANWQPSIYLDDDLFAQQLAMDGLTRDSLLRIMGATIGLSKFSESSWARPFTAISAHIPVNSQLQSLTQSAWPTLQPTPPFWQFLSPFMNWVYTQISSFLNNHSLQITSDDLMASILRGL